MTAIEEVAASVAEHRQGVEAFTGQRKDRQFLYLDEMLTRCLLQLDNVDPDGRDDVRQARRNVIKDINAAIALLETKANENAQAKPAEEAAAEAKDAAAAPATAAPAAAAPATAAPTAAAPSEQPHEQAETPLPNST